MHSDAEETLSFSVASLLVHHVYFWKGIWIRSCGYKKNLSYLLVYFIKMTNARNNKKLDKATIGNQKQNERKKALRNDNFK